MTRRDASGPTSNLRAVPEEDAFEDLTPSVSGTAALPENPRLRADLIVAQVEKEKVLVRIAKADAGFPIYNFEWSIAQLMDGTRSIEQLATELGKRGIGATPSSVRSFVREMNGYGFLDTQVAGAATASARPTAEAQSPEEKPLLEAAVAMQARGDFKAAADYLLAILEINPSNHGVRALLRSLQTEAPRPTIPDIATPTLETPSGHRPTPTSRRGALLVAAATLLAVGAGAAFFLFRPSPAGNAPAVAPAATPTDAASQPPSSVTEQRLRAQLLAQLETTLAAPSSGTVATVSVRAGQDVAPGMRLMELADAGALTRVMEAEKEAEGLRERAKKDRVAGFFARSATKKANQLRKNLKMTPVIAPMNGIVGEVLRQPLEQVTMGETLLKVLDIQSLRAQLPLSEIKLDILNASCEVELDKTPRKCRVSVLQAEGRPERMIEIVVTNPDRFRPGTWAAVVLTQTPSQKP